MSSVSPDMRNRVVEAYLGHRLNNNELVDLMRRSQESPAEVEDSFNSYTARDQDWRGDILFDDLTRAIDELGLNEQYQGLDESEVWSAEDRAVHRRLSHLDFDPATEPPPSPPTALDSRLIADVEANFTKWDRNGNIMLERQELDYIMSGGMYGEKLEESNDPSKAAALATLLRYHSLLGSGRPDEGPELSVGDLRAWSTSDDRINTGAMAAVNQTYAEYLRQAQSMTTSSLHDEAITGANIHQGVVGSCVLLSTLIGTDESQLRGMVNGTSDGNFTVNFLDGSSEELAEPSLAARLHHSQGQDGERWPAVLEIAVAQKLSRSKEENENGLRGLLEGIDPEFAIPALTGRPADKRSIDDLSVAQTRELLAESMASGGPVICGSRPNANGDFINVEELHNGIANGHCYAIKSFDGKSDTVRLQNPWHKGEWKHGSDADIDNDGVFEMPLRDFYSSFRWITFAKQDVPA